MKIVNICMLAPFTEGYSYQDPMLSEYQCREGHDVTVITGIKTRNSNGECCELEPSDSVLPNGVRLIRITHHGIGKLFDNIFGIYPQIYDLLNEIKPELIMVHGLATHAVYYAVKYHKIHANTHLIADNHQDSANTNNRNILLVLLAKYYKLCWKSWEKHFDKIYGVTSWRTQFAHDQYGIPYEKLDDLVLGIDDQYINLCEDEDNRQAVRKQYNIPQGAFVVCSGGKIDSNKAIIEMMTAFNNCKDDNLRYLIFGSVSNDIKDIFYKLINEDKRIVYTGFVPPDFTNNLLAASDFGLFAGLHSVLWEQAAGCGLPCMFRRYSNKDHLDVGGNCYRIDCPDIDEIHKVIKKVSQKDEEFLHMKKAAKNGAKYFSYSEIAQKSLECMD